MSEELKNVAKFYVDFLGNEHETVEDILVSIKTKISDIKELRKSNSYDGIDGLNYKDTVIYQRILEMLYGIVFLEKNPFTLISALKWFKTEILA